jgi:hypothetical protein
MKEIFDIQQPKISYCDFKQVYVRVNEEEIQVEEYNGMEMCLIPSSLMAFIVAPLLYLSLSLLKCSLRKKYFKKPEEKRSSLKT